MPVFRTVANEGLLRCLFGFFLTTLMTLTPPASGGGGPENVLLVVNARSDGSKEVANHYVALRDLPPSNVLYLDYEGPLDRISGERFRREIMRPVLEAIEKRKLGLQIDIIAYSIDFPWLVNLAKDYPPDLKVPKTMAPAASLTGATFLYPYVLAKSPGALQRGSNWYLPVATERQRTANLAVCTDVKGVPSRAFRSRYTWNEEHRREADPKNGLRYLMSTMLGVTDGRGNSVAEVIESLDRAVAAEASPPAGTFYFVRNNSPRSKPRHNGFPTVVNELRQLGAKAVIRQGVTPVGAKDVAGLMLGSGDLGLEKANLTIQPGAICEHFTSYGAVFKKKWYQTPLSDLIRAGATGASGAVQEPYAIQAKFPLPTLQVHYRRGCSLAESFYQSVASPYQLLVVGDPLCQPWAKRPQLVVKGWPGSGVIHEELGDLSTLGFAGLGIELPEKAAPAKPEGSKSGEEPADSGPPPALSITPRVVRSSGKPGGVWELFVDGRLRMRLPSGRGIEMTAEQLGFGWHDLRCVAIDADPLEAQRRQPGGITVSEIKGKKAAGTFLRIDSASTTRWGKLAVSARADGAERIVIRQHSRVVGTIDGESGGVLIPAPLLGRGRVRLQAVAEPTGAASSYVWAQID